MTLAEYRGKFRSSAQKSVVTIENRIDRNHYNSTAIRKRAQHVPFQVVSLEMQLHAVRKWYIETHVKATTTR
jgi:hypothetical protein